jgi:hypothetical protein
MTVTGELVDHWTIVDTRPCRVTGDGTVTVSFQLAKPKLVSPVIDSSAAGEPNNSPGSWVIGIPGPLRGVNPIKSQNATGTITLVDNTTQNPPEPDSGPCEPVDKSGCGTTHFGRAAKVRISGYNRRFILADLTGVDFDLRGGSGRATNCRISELTRFTDRLAGGTRAGELLLKMPRASSVARKRVTTVVGTSHKNNLYEDCEGSDNACSEDVTRRVTVVFKHL